MRREPHRGVLEYAILDNANKFRIDPLSPPDRRGQRSGKRLFHLIKELGPLLPEHAESMEELRRLGNKCIHPRKTDDRKSLMFSRQTDAKRSLELLVDIVEAPYLSSGSKLSDHPAI